MRTENNDREEDKEALLRQQFVLARFGELALRSDDLDEILHEACRLVQDALGTELSKVMEIQEDRTTLLVRAGIGWKPGVVGHVTVKAEQGTSEGYALELGKPVISANIDVEKRFSYPDFLKENGVKALVNVPILGAEDRPHYGLLQVDSRRPRDFTEGDITFLQSYANLIAAAVERLRILDELHHRNTALEHRVADGNRALEKEQYDRKAAEEQLRQSQKMEAVGQLTGGIAHDFNNMLAGIMGNLELMQMRMAQGQTDNVARYVTGAMNVAHRAAALTHRLLAFSRRQTLAPKPIDINQLVRSMEELMRRTLGPDVLLETHLDGALWISYCDPNQLESALLNLAINSRDAMPSGGHLTIATKNSTLSRKDTANQPGTLPGEYIEISVSDTGAGMTPEVLSRAIDPFFTTKPIGQGTGLGLSMIYGFVTQSSGVLQIDSAAGSGTTVRMFLPRYADIVEEGAPAQNLSDAPRASAELTIMLVEDEDAVRHLATEVLEGIGYNVIAAADASAALPILESPQHVDLLISDVGLPDGMNGKQLAEAARALRPALKILFITGFAEQATVGDLLPEAGVQIMTKPFSMVTFAGKVQEIIEKNDPPRPH